MKKSLLFAILVVFLIFNAQAKLIHAKLVERVFDVNNQNVFVEKHAIFIDKNEIKDPYIINEKLINYITTLIMIFKDLMTKEEKRDLDYLLRHERQEIIELFKDKKMILTDIGGMTDYINTDRNDVSQSVFYVTGFIDHEGRTIEIDSIIFNNEGIYVTSKDLYYWLETYPPRKDYYRLKIYPTEQELGIEVDIARNFKDLKEYWAHCISDKIAQHEFRYMPNIISLLNKKGIIINNARKLVVKKGKKEKSITFFIDGFLRADQGDLGITAIKFVEEYNDFFDWPSRIFIHAVGIDTHGCIPRPPIILYDVLTK